MMIGEQSEKKAKLKELRKKTGVPRYINVRKQERKPMSLKSDKQSRYPLKQSGRCQYSLRGKDFWKRNAVYNTRSAVVAIGV